MTRREFTRTSIALGAATALGSMRVLGANDRVAMGLCLESLIPFAAGHEIIRQNKANLTLIGPISDILFDQLLIPAQMGGTSEYVLMCLASVYCQHPDYQEGWAVAA